MMKNKSSAAFKINYYIISMRLKVKYYPVEALDRQKTTNLQTTAYINSSPAVSFPVDVVDVLSAKPTRFMPTLFVRHGQVNK